MADNQKESKAELYQELRDSVKAFGAKHSLSRKELIDILKEILELLQEGDIQS